MFLTQKLVEICYKTPKWPTREAYSKGILNFLGIIGQAREGVELAPETASIFDFFTKNIFLDPWAPDQWFWGSRTLPRCA